MAKYEIELPDMVCDADGVTYLPTGEFRAPDAGEFFLNCYGNVELTDVQLRANQRIILRPIWKWPTALAGWGIAMDERGGSTWFSHPAKIICDGWGYDLPTNRAAWPRGADMWMEIPTYKLSKVVAGFTSPGHFPGGWRVPVLNPNWGN